MDGQILSVTLSQMLVMMFFVAAGWLLGKKKIIPPDGSNVLSKLEINLFMPLMVLNNLSSNVTVENAKEKGNYFLASVPLLLLIILSANLLARLFAKERQRQNMLIYAFSFANCGYLGYPVIRAVFGEEMLSNFILFMVPSTLALYSYGQSLFDPEEKKPLYRKLIKPVTVSLVIGVAIGLLGLKLPTAVSTALSTGADMVGPTAMLMTGIILSRCSLRKLLIKPFSYLVAFIKLVAYPAVIFAVMYLLGARGPLLLCAVTVGAMPVGMNIIVFPTANGLDSTEGAGHCLIANILSVITVPVIFSVLARLM